MNSSSDPAFNQAKLVHVIRDTIQEIEAFYGDYLFGRRTPMHLATRLCAMVDPRRSFIRAEPRSDGRVIAAWISHKPKKHPPVENPRLFDLLYFAAMLLMELAGGRFRFDSDLIGGKLYFWLRYEAPGDKRTGRRINIARIIKNTEAGKETPFAKDHYSYCWSDLDTASASHRPRHAKFGRPDSIVLARGLYEMSQPSALGLSTDAFEELLNDVFRVADRLPAWPIDSPDMMAGWILSSGKPLGSAKRSDLLDEAAKCEARAKEIRALLEAGDGVR